jgi:hypothetical protein
MDYAEDAVTQQFPIEIPALVRLVRRVFPGASSVSVEDADGGRPPVVYRARVDDATFYLRVAEVPDDDLTTDARIPPNSTVPA